MNSRVPDFGSGRRVLSETLISDEMLLWLESRAEDGTWNPKGSPRDPQGGFHEIIVSLKYDVGPSNRGTRVAESKSTIGIDKAMISEKMLLWLEFRAGDVLGIPRDPQGASRDPQDS